LDRWVNSYNEVRQALDPVVGVPFKELAPALGMTLPADPTRRKAVGGHLVESLLSIAKNSLRHADLDYLGTEVKTIPLNTRSSPRQWTKITAFRIDETSQQPDFRHTPLFGKLRSILFVPIMKTDNTIPDFWYLRPPFLWLPTEGQLEQMETDYLGIHQACLTKDWSRLTGRAGTYLTLKVSDSTTKGKADADKRRAWWLTVDLTKVICEQNLWPKGAISSEIAEA
jgi:DNA mismatch repair protein MutH